MYVCVLGRDGGHDEKIKGHSSFDTCLPGAPQTNEFGKLAIKADAT